MSRIPVSSRITLGDLCNLGEIFAQEIDDFQTSFVSLKVRPIATTAPAVWDVIETLLEGLDWKVLVLDRINHRDLSMTR